MIEEKIGKAECVVVAWSESAIKSDWVMDEADDGRQRAILVPLLLDNVRPPMGFRSMQTANPVASVGSIVVLPFDTMSSDPCDAYLAAGLTGEVTGDIARLLAKLGHVHYRFWNTGTRFG